MTFALKEEDKEKRLSTAFDAWLSSVKEDAGNLRRQEPTLEVTGSQRQNALARKRNSTPMAQTAAWPWICLGTRQYLLFFRSGDRPTSWDLKDR